MRNLTLNMVAGVSLLAGLVPAAAQTISGTYYEDARTNQCSSTAQCKVDFPLPAAIAGKFLFVHFVSCSGSTAQPVAYGQLSISDDGANKRRLQALENSGTEVGGRFGIRNQVEYKVTGGPPRVISVTLFSNNGSIWEVQCMITGELVTE